MRRLLDMVIVPGILALAAAVATGLWHAMWHMPFPSLGVFVLTVLLAIQVGYLLHEAGHLMGARLAGFRPRLLTALLVRVVWVDGKARLEAPRDLSGYVIVTPVGLQNLERRWIVLSAGGPAASLLLGAALGVGAFWLAPAGVAYALLQCAAFTIAMGLITLIPFRSAGTISDGARLRLLWQGGAVARRDVALWAISSLVNGDDRPRAVPQELLDRALALQDESPEQAHAEALASLCAFDRGEPAVGLHLWERAMGLIERLPWWMRPYFYLEAAYMVALYEADPIKAADCLKKSTRGIDIEPWDRARAAGAVALAAGEPARALALAREGLQALAGRKATGVMLMDQDLLEDLAARAAAALAVQEQVSDETTA